jgi:hypothetical protein
VKYAQCCPKCGSKDILKVQGSRQGMGLETILSSVFTQIIVPNMSAATVAL